MKRFTFGADKINLDPWGIRSTTGPISVVEADGYRIEEGFVTFVRDGSDFFSVPVARVAIVAELTDDNNLPMEYVAAS